jgi:hypothetical protein
LFGGEFQIQTGEIILELRYLPHLLITHPASNSVSVLNLSSKKVERVVHVPGEPQLVRPDDRIAYVSCDQKQVAAINISSGKIENLIEVGAGADGLAWIAANP